MLVQILQIPKMLSWNHIMFPPIWYRIVVDLWYLRINRIMMPCQGLESPPKAPKMAFYPLLTSGKVPPDHPPKVGGFAVLQISPSTPIFRLGKVIVIDIAKQKQRGYSGTERAGDISRYPLSVHGVYQVFCQESFGIV